MILLLCTSCLCTYFNPVSPPPKHQFKKYLLKKLTGHRQRSKRRGWGRKRRRWGLIFHYKTVGFLLFRLNPVVPKKGSILDLDRASGRRHSRIFLLWAFETKFRNKFFVLTFFISKIFRRQRAASIFWNIFSWIFDSVGWHYIISLWRFGKLKYESNLLHNEMRWWRGDCRFWPA